MHLEYADVLNFLQLAAQLASASGKGGSTADIGVHCPDTSLRHEATVKTAVPQQQGVPCAVLFKGDPSLQSLLGEARSVRSRIFGNEVFLRGVIEFSSHCRQQCQYCGLRAGNSRLERFRLTQDEILEAAEHAAVCGVGTVVLQAGEDVIPAGGYHDGCKSGDGFDPAAIAACVQSIKKRYSVAVTLSLGVQSEDVYRLWRDAGADRYLLKLETTDQALHARLRPGRSVAERLNHLAILQRLGFETGSGIITGLPGMTPAILARDIMALSAMGLDMLAAGPFIPHADTPLHDCPGGQFEEALVVTAILRLLNGGANIPATSALDVLAANGRECGLWAGANVVMPSVTPDQVRRGYAIYPGKNAAGTTVHRTLQRILSRLNDAGYTPSASKGNSRVVR